MQPLNFPKYQFRIKSSENRLHIFDVIRKKFVLLQSEEWVRQHVVHFLDLYQKIPEKLNQRRKAVECERFEETL